MAEFNGFFVYTDSYLADTIDLTTLEHGAYDLLLFSMWRTRGGCLPNDEDRLRRITKLSNSAWPKVWAKLRDRFFVDAETMEPITPDTSSITQKKLSGAYAEAQAKREKAREAGSKGGKAKSLKYKKSDKANATNSLRRNGSQPSISLEQNCSSPSTEHRLPITDRSSERSLEEKLTALCEAAGGNVSHGSTGIEVIKDILDLEAQGCDFEQDILPTVRDRVPRMDSPLRTWGARWLRDAILERKAARLSARGKSKNGNGAHAEPDWDLILSKFSVVDWLHTAWGPPPGEPGCRVPEEILKKHNLITA